MTDTAQALRSPAILVVEDEPLISHCAIDVIEHAGFENNDGGPTALRVEMTGTVVPEASTWAMMALGLVGLGLAGYRSTRRSVSMAA